MKKIFLFFSVSRDGRAAQLYVTNEKGKRGKKKKKPVIIFLLEKKKEKNFLRLTLGRSSSSG